MPSEQTRAGWFAQSEKIYEEVKVLDGLQQFEVLRHRLDVIENEHAKSAIEFMVWSWLRDGKPEKSVSQRDLLTTNNILIATFVAVFLIVWLEIGVSIVWAGTLAFVTVVLLRFVFRMFDRGFMFRRLFTACVSSGLFLIVPATWYFEFETRYGPVSYGGAPGGALIMIWAICTVLTFGAAVWEHVASERT
ncbi:hypothetical protein [Ruegeria arenilitoris]|uniref:hypothetical protein n=1 Tax=Ruegeria arenilitoris TaxID=1173585 RepID=UPI00148052EE|nr:hypothetical protein [Ruegeria arenilitoris]